MDIDLERRIINHAKANVRDEMIMRIIGFQNEKYYKEDSEGYKALQDLLECIENIYEKMFSEYKG